MARQPRLHIPGGIYHVILRGNGGQDIFFAKSDRTQFSLLLQEGAERFDYRLHAFCLMTNHVHLLIQTGHNPLSKIMQNLSLRYTQYINKRKKRSGHLFQGRYKAFLVDADAYLLELVRYIHNNPVRAGLTEDTLDYAWSSHRAYLGLEELPYLTTDWVLGQFGRQVKASRRKYAEFIAKGKNEEHREEYYRGESDNRILGDDSFVQKLLAREENEKPPSLAAIVKAVCRHYKIRESDMKTPSRARILSEARGVVGWLATESAAASLSEVAACFGRDLATVSRVVGSIDKKVRTLPDYRESMEKIKNKLGRK
jgi:putative transposase